MRYTTIIDIIEIDAIYRNPAARLLYLHMALRAGYHDNDRDICSISIRRLAAEVGISISATRHALSILERAALIDKLGTSWRVKKFILNAPISPRVKSEKKRKEIEAKEYERQQQREREMREAEERARMKAEEQRTGKTAYQRYVEDLERRAAAGDKQAIHNLKMHKH